MKFDVGCDLKELKEYWGNAFIGFRQCMHALRALKKIGGINDAAKVYLDLI